MGLLLFGGNNFNPKKITNLKLWFDANKINQSDNTSVSSWSDLSGNFWNATQSTSTSQPTFKKSEANFNNKSCLFFDGGDYFLVDEASKGILNNATGCTIFSVANPTNTAIVNSTIFKMDIGGTGSIRVALRKTNTNLRLTGKIKDTDLSINSTGSTSLTTDRAIVLHGTWDINAENPVTAGTPVLRQYINNVQNATANLTLASKGNFSATDSFTPHSIGANADTVSGATFITGYIGELIVYNRLLNIAEQTLIYNYLKSKWGI